MFKLFSWFTSKKEKEGDSILTCPGCQEVEAIKFTKKDGKYFCRCLKCGREWVE